MAGKKGIVSPKTVTVQVVRRHLLPPSPGTAAPLHSYTPVLTTRAEVKSRAGATEWGQVDIDGKKATHTFTIRFTTVPFDARDRIRDATGQIYQILTIENVDLGRREMRIHCASQGDEGVPAAR